MVASTDARATSRRASESIRRVVSSDVRPVQSEKPESVGRRERICAAAAAASSSTCLHTGQRPSLRIHSRMHVA
eukprot:scaffold2912_cov129-Isochrysis_galbana.AAC.4